MLAICEDCRKLKNVELPSRQDPAWLEHAHPDVKWRCATCYWKALANVTGQTLEIEIRKTYLMPYQTVIPFLASIAFIIMTCLEIAWHS